MAWKWKWSKAVCVCVWGAGRWDTRGYGPCKCHYPVQLFVHGGGLDLGHRGQAGQCNKALQAAVQQLTHDGQGWTRVQTPDEGNTLHLCVGGTGGGPK
jgi:hypothetical protein